MKKIFFLVLLVSIFNYAQNFKFAWLSDIHIGYPTAEKDLINSVKSINSIDDISFTIISGDITATGTYHELSTAKKILDELSQLYYIIPGNHDTKWSESGCTDFIRLWGNDRFVFRIENIVFIGLHQGPRMRMADGHFAPEDLGWFDSVISDSLKKDDKLIFVTHYPLDQSISNWYEMTDRLKKLNTQFVLFGHGHRNKIFNLEDIEGLMGRSNLSSYNNASGFNIVEIKEDSVKFYEVNLESNNPFLWHITTLNNKVYDLNKNFNRPDYSINNQFRNVKILWQQNTGNTIGSSAAYDDNAVYLGDLSGNFYSLDLVSGKENWRFKTRNAIYSTPEIHNDFLVFGSADSSIYCINKNTGNLNWEFKANAAVLSSPLIYDNKVFIGSSDNKFRAIDLLTGELIWEFGELKGFVESEPKIYNNKIFFGAWDEHFYCLDLISGKLIWKWRGDVAGIFYSPAVCNPVIANDNLFIVAPDRKITALDIKTGKEFWRTNKYQVRETIGINEKKNLIFIRTMNDTILALPASNKLEEPLWIKNFDFGYDISSAQIIEKDGMIFYPTKNGLILAINSSTGELIWKYKISNGYVNTLTVIDSRNIIATDFDGKVTYLKIKY